MLQVTILTSAFCPEKYLDQYLTGISHLKSLKDQINISLAFGCISEYNQKHIDEIAERVNNVCRDAGVKLYFYQNEPGTKENYSQTINNLIAHTIENSRNFAILNLDDYRTPEGLLGQAQILEAGADFTYGDYACVNNMDKALDGKSSKEDYGYFYEETYPDIDLNNKVKYYSRFLYGPFLAFKAQICRKLAVYDEHFTCSSDFDIVSRWIFHDCKGVKTSGLIGLFTSAGVGLSTKPDTAGVQEGQVILNRFLLNRFPTIINFGKPILWRNLKK